jgi:hypothetical protein
MRPDARFLKKPKSFWATVRSITQEWRSQNLDRRLIESPSLAFIQAEAKKSRFDDKTVRIRGDEAAEEVRKELRLAVGALKIEMPMSDLVQMYFATRMMPAKAFTQQSPDFWNLVKVVTKSCNGRPVVDNNRPAVPTHEDIARIFSNLGLNEAAIINQKGIPTPLAQELQEYFVYRSDALRTQIEPNLMDFSQAQDLFEKLRVTHRNCPLPMNKQKGAMKAHAYLTCAINLILEREIGTLNCDYDPRKLTTFTKNGAPFRTLSRRVDGAFPDAVNPVSIWEVKEYYYTTTFGSRVAGGVYETLLDGMELEEFSSELGVPTRHYLFIDAYYTWWVDGKSYLNRMVDMLHMGFVDEIIIGREVANALPATVKEMVAILNARP